MPYVERDANNKIIALYKDASPQAKEELSPTHPAIIGFLFDDELEVKNKKFKPSVFDIEGMSLSDLGMVRVIEDLIDVLIKKHLINITDLPEAAIERLQKRKTMRSRLEAIRKVINDEDRSVQ
jgi:hypothetical protein